MHEMLNPVFWKKNRKKYFNMSSAENFTQSTKRYSECSKTTCREFMNLYILLSFLMFFFFLTPAFAGEGTIAKKKDRW